MMPLQGQTARSTAQAKGMTRVLREKERGHLKNTMGQEGTKAWRRGLDQDQT